MKTMLTKIAVIAAPVKLYIKGITAQQHNLL